MSETPVIKAEKLSKKFSRSLRTSLWYGLTDILRQFWVNDQRQISLREQEFWALRDISFELQRGDALGIIGNNGAGKSTLLKLLMGRLIPSYGTATCYGKIVAITHLGLGFNPVLSGRENIFINAAILGMPRKKTLEIFDAIIDFAEIGDFIDAPVQTYSAGMKARLGYAVAAHLDPDILLIDEVLAVGDLAFKRKCRQHIRKYINDGGTLILISHDMQAVQTICERCIVLDHGRIVFDGGATEGVHHYYESQRQQLDDLPRMSAPPVERVHSEHNGAHFPNGTASSGPDAHSEDGGVLESASPPEQLPGVEVQQLAENIETTGELLGTQSGNASDFKPEQAAGEAEVAAAAIAAGESSPEPDVVRTADQSAHDANEHANFTRPHITVAETESHSLSGTATVPSEPVLIHRIRFEPLAGGRVRTGNDVRVTIDYESFEDIDDVVCGFTICTPDLTTHIASGLYGFEQETRTVKRGSGEISCIIRQFPLLPGRYAVKAGMGDASTGGAIADRGWQGTPPDYFVVESEAKVVNNMHSVIGDLVKLHVDWD